MERAFEIVVVVDPLPPTLRLRGEFDHRVASQFLEALEAVAAASPEELVIDVSDLLFIDSSGLRALVRAKAEVGSVVVTGAGPWMRRIFEVSGLDAVFRFDAQGPGRRAVTTTRSPSR